MILYRYKVLNRHNEYRGFTLDFARDDLTLWLYSTADGDAKHSGYGTLEELERDKRYLSSMGVLLIDTGNLQLIGRVDEFTCNNCRHFYPDEYQGDKDVFPCDSTSRLVSRHIELLVWQKTELTPANVGNHCPGFQFKE